MRWDGKASAGFVLVWHQSVWLRLHCGININYTAIKIARLERRLCVPARAFPIALSGSRLHGEGDAVLVGVFPMCLPHTPTRLFCTTVSLAIWCSPTGY
jgi:hypothetical protein